MSRTLSLTTTAFSPEVFASVKLTGKEYLNELFEYQLIIKTPDLDGYEFYQQFESRNPAANVDLTAWLGQSVTVNIELDGKEITFSEINNTFRQFFKKTVGKGTRYINGIITGAQYLYRQGRSDYYQIILSPFIQPATLRNNYKIWQDRTPIQIIEELLTDYPGTIDKRLEEQKENRYPQRDYQTQFSETDFQYFARICAEWGINYWFEHAPDGHTLVLSDEPQNHKQQPSEAYHSISYYPQGHKINEEYLHEFNIIAQAVSGAFASADYDYARASSEILEGKHNIQPYPEAQKQGIATSSNKITEQAPKKGEIFEYAADVVQPEAGANHKSNNALEEQILRNQWNIERLQQQHLNAKAKGNIRGITTGYTFQLEKHPSVLANIHWTVKGTELFIMDLAEESQRKENNLPSLLDSQLTDKLSKLLGNTNQQWLIDCQAELIPANIPIRPEKIAKPEGTLQNAIVVGEAEAGSIYTDSYGRIKVQFYWDRYHNKDENSSCWIRVNEPWAGNQMGAVFTPRVGQEVLISYINQDPDLPVVMGKVNNSDNMPPWALAQNKSLSGFRSRELPEGNSHSGRSNHLVFDDSEGKIQTQLKSDHAHSQLSLGDITRIEDNQGRKDARGQGFELRTDDWGSARAAKGLYLTTFPREGATSTHMDAYEAQQLLEEAKQLVKQLSKLANTHQAEPLSGTEPLDLFSKITKSELPKHPDAMGDAANPLIDNLLGENGFNLSSLTNQINEINTLQSVLPNGLPNEVKAKATEDILKNLAKQHAIPPIEPITKPGELFYDGAKAVYQKQLKAFENNPYDKAREKLKELDKITDKKEKAETLLKDKGIKDIFSNLKANGKDYQQLQEEIPQFSPKGFEENILVGAGEAGIALVTPKETHQYSAEKHTITTGQDLNVTTGNSWLASMGNKLSFFVQQGIKIFSGKGKVQIQANSNNIELVADKTVKVISANDKVEVIAKEEILINSGGAYIRIKDGNIYFHAPGTIEHKGAAHPLMGPTSLAKEMPRLPSSELNIAERFSIYENLFGRRSANQPYKVFLEDGTTYEGKTNEYGETQVIESHIPQKAYIASLNGNNEIIHISERQMIWDKELLYDTYAQKIDTQKNKVKLGDKNKPLNAQEDSRADTNQTSTAPYAFGMRFPQFTGQPPKLTDYPVVKEYYETFYKEFMALDLETIFKPFYENKARLKSGQNSDYEAVAKLQKEYFDSGAWYDYKRKITDVFLNSAKIALMHPSINNLALPVDDNLLPVVEFVEAESVFIGGIASARQWQIEIKKMDLNSFVYDLLVHGKFRTKGFMARRGAQDIISTYLHELRHIQQFFWVYGYTTCFKNRFQISDQHPRFAKQIPKLGFWAEMVKDKVRTCWTNNMNQLKTAMEQNDYVSEALEQMSIVFAYRHMYLNRNHPQIKPEYDCMYALVKERFVDYLGKKGEAINIDYFVYEIDGAGTYEQQQYGYKTLPHENDARITQEIFNYIYDIHPQGENRNEKTTHLKIPPANQRYSADYPTPSNTTGTN